ncbi:hypothetical protein Btru_024996 [Bulinus truncatus]|nr:hypothetical protein Btru_024996 [Bulinus truncatus]
MIPLQVSEIAAAYLERRDIERKEKVSLLISHVIDSDTGKVLSHCGPQEIKFETWSKSSPSGKLKAVIKQLKDKKNEDRQYLEIYDNNRKLKSFDLFAMEKHGKIIENDVNLEVEWSQSESHLLYIAEKKKTKSGSFFSAKGFQDKSSDEQIQIRSGVVNIARQPSLCESPGQVVFISCGVCIGALCHMKTTLKNTVITTHTPHDMRTI